MHTYMYIYIFLSLKDDLSGNDVCYNSYAIRKFLKKIDIN